MCLDPVTLAIVATVAMTAGSGMQAMGQAKADKAMYRTFSREQARQKGFESEQVAKFQDSLRSTQEVLDPAAQAAAEAKRRDAYESVTKGSTPQTGAYLPGSKSAAPVVADHAAQAGRSAEGRTSNLAQALAVLGGMGDLMQENDRTIARNGMDISQLGGFARGSMDVLQAEMDAAKRKGSTLRTLGGLAQSIGQMAMMAGGGGGGGGGPMTVGNINPGSLFQPVSFETAMAPLPSMAI